jgi:hypothetical protein
VRLIFRWVGIDRVSLREVCRRLQKVSVHAGGGDSAGPARWCRRAV